MAKRSPGFLAQAPGWDTFPADVQHILARHVLTKVTGFVVEAFRFQGTTAPINRIACRDPGHHAGWSRRDLNEALLWLWDQDQVLPVAFNDPATHGQLVEFGGRQSFYWVFMDHWASLGELQDLFHIVDLHEASKALSNWTTGPALPMASCELAARPIPWPGPDEDHGSQARGSDQGRFAGAGRDKCRVRASGGLQIRVSGATAEGDEQRILCSMTLVGPHAWYSI